MPCLLVQRFALYPSNSDESIHGFVPGFVPGLVPGFAHYVFLLVQVRIACSTFEWRLVGSFDDNIKVAEVVFVGDGTDAGSRVGQQALCFL